jgi:multicomponent Na+:H+ antiporter subunit E
MKWLTCLIAVFALWMLLFWSLDPWVIGTGAFLALVVGTLLADVYPDGFEKVLDPRRWLFFLLYLPYFLYYCIRANVDVMLRVVHPDVPIRPGIVKVTTTLTSDMAKTFLANSITLTPGTLTIDIDGQDLYVHWINIHTDDAAARTAEICGRFEPLLRRIFE